MKRLSHICQEGPGFTSLCLAIALSGTLSGAPADADSSIVGNQINRLVSSLMDNLPRQQIGVAVLKFETSEGRSEVQELGEAAAILIGQNLVQDPTVSVVERQRMNEIMEEIGLSQAGLTENEIEVGNLLNVDFLISGTVADMGDRFLLAARIIEVETGNIVQSTSVEVPSKTFLNVSSKLVVVRKYPITAAFRSMIFPGWGQFYNDQPRKGTIILITELALLGSTVSSYMLYRQSKGHYDRATTRDHAVQYFDEMEAHARVNWINLASFAGVWFCAAVDAYIQSYKLINAAQFDE